MSILDPDMAEKQAKLNETLTAANSEYHVKFLETARILRQLEQLEQQAGGLSRRTRPLFSDEVIKRYTDDLQATIPSTIDQDEERVKAVMGEIRYRCNLPTRPSGDTRYRAYYLESDQGAVEECRERAVQLEADLTKVVNNIRTTWEAMETLRHDPS